MRRPDFDDAALRLFLVPEGLQRRFHLIAVRRDHAYLLVACLVILRQHPAEQQLEAHLDGLALVLLGQHSLGVFASSILISVFGEAILFTHPGWISQILVQGLGTVALIGVGALAAWNSNKNRPEGRATVVSATGNTVKKSALPVGEEQEAVTNFSIARADVL